jgi:hypothetical protein
LDDAYALNVFPLLMSLTQYGNALTAVPGDAEVGPPVLARELR